MILTQTINSLFDLTVLKKGGGDRRRKKYLSVLDWCLLITFFHLRMSVFRALLVSLHILSQSLLSNNLAHINLVWKDRNTCHKRLYSSSEEDVQPHICSFIPKYVTRNNISGLLYKGYFFQCLAINLGFCLYNILTSSMQVAFWDLLVTILWS